MFDLPFPLCKKCYFKHLKLVYSGCLVMLCDEESSMQLWVLEDYDTKIWSKRPTISMKAVQGDGVAGTLAYTSSLSLDSFDIVLMKGFWSQIFHNFKTCSSNVCKLNVNLNLLNEIFSFQSHLDPVHLKIELWEDGTFF
jgi:hypothetical protein